MTLTLVVCQLIPTVKSPGTIATTIPHEALKDVLRCEMLLIMAPKVTFPLEGLRATVAQQSTFLGVPGLAECAGAGAGAASV